jgi:flagellin-like hook-associated protein FlgL
LTNAGGASLTVQDVVDQINNDNQLNSFIKASFDSSTGQLSIKATSADTRTIAVGLVGNDANTQANFGFGGANLAAIGTTQNAEARVYPVGTAAGALQSLESDYNSILTQIDQLIGDSNYRGTNLLNGDNLTTFFNESRTSSLTVEGGNFTSAGLGLKSADFKRSVTISESINQVRSATESIRSFGSSLANNLAVIQTRQDFTKDLINELDQGADKLTVADPNQEGAKLLALQTRQQLGVTALSLASQSQQSVLRLF